VVNAKIELNLVPNPLQCQNVGGNFNETTIK
jgi:hypothetical protein